PGVVRDSFSGSRASKPIALVNTGAAKIFLQKSRRLITKIVVPGIVEAAWEVPLPRFTKPNLLELSTVQFDLFELVQHLCRLLRLIQFVVVSGKMVVRRGIARAEHSSLFKHGYRFENLALLFTHFA